MSRRKFSRALKRAICIEYMQSGQSRQEISVKYDLPNVNLKSASNLNGNLNCSKELEHYAS